VPPGAEPPLVERAIVRADDLGSTRASAARQRTDRPDQLEQLQVNLIQPCRGRRRPLPAGVVRAVLLLRANVLLRPTSGVRPELVDALVALLNAGVVPLVPEQGSVGASGDLAPLSHIALALMGEGSVLGANAVRPAAEALSAAGLQPFRLAGRGWPSSMVPRRRRRCLRSWCTMPACCGVRLRRRPR
jgi:histidine ammonia-lyase